MDKYIEVTITRDGNNAIVSGHGFSGASCVSAMSELETAIGTTKRARSMHDEQKAVPKQKIVVNNDQ